MLHQFQHSCMIEHISCAEIRTVLKKLIFEVVYNWFSLVRVHKFHAMGQKRTTFLILQQLSLISFLLANIISCAMWQPKVTSYIYKTRMAPKDIDHMKSLFNILSTSQTIRST